MMLKYNELSELSKPISRVMRINGLPVCRGIEVSNKA